MRTVHEIETGKPQEPPTKAPSIPDHKTKRRRSPSFTEAADEEVDQKSDADDPDLAMYSAASRYRYLKRKLRWATERNADLKEELQYVQDTRWRNWAEKEKLLGQVLAKENIDLAYFTTGT
jgi:hypothetical protein